MGQQKVLLKNSVKSFSNHKSSYIKIYKTKLYVCLFKVIRDRCKIAPFCTSFKFNTQSFTDVNSYRIDFQKHKNTSIYQQSPLSAKSNSFAMVL